jgi:DNA-binding MarR family transcriptional regulator
MGHLIRRAQQKHLALWKELVSTEISSVQYAAMAYLERRPGASQNELGAELDVDRSTVADLVARMDKHGLLERLPHDSDRRRYALSLTETGHQEVGRLRPRVYAANAQLTAGLSAPQQSALRSLLKQLAGEPVLSARSDHERTRRTRRK